MTVLIMIQAFQKGNKGDRSVRMGKEAQAGMSVARPEKVNNHLNCRELGKIEEIIDLPSGYLFQLDLGLDRHI